MACCEVHPLFHAGFTHDEKELGQDMAELFFDYWRQKSHPFFGKDAPYHRPPNSVVTENMLRHVHIVPLTPTETELRRWASHDPMRRTSDRCFVYTRSCCDRALLLAYLHEDAHEIARDHDFLRALGRAAESWFMSNGLFPNPAWPI